MPSEPPPGGELVQPRLPEMMALFCQIGLTSFGGGLSAWLYRETVQRKRWISAADFLDALAVCQALPGLNISNMAVWLGRRFAGLPGVCCAMTGIILLPSLAIVVIAVLFATMASLPTVQTALAGATAAAVALPLSMGWNMASRVRRALAPQGIMIATFVMIGIFKLPLIPVALGCGTLSIALEAWHLRSRQ